MGKGRSLRTGEYEPKKEELNGNETPGEEANAEDKNKEEDNTFSAEDKSELPSESATRITTPEPSSPVIRKRSSRSCSRSRGSHDFILPLILPLILLASITPPILPPCSSYALDLDPIELRTRKPRLQVRKALLL